MAESYNVVVVGKTGVGKSSLINYLYGDNARETGVGKPVTQRGFEHVEFSVDGLNLRIYDSWGLEADKSQEWKNDLYAELQKRDIHRPVNEWFHTIFYCISAGSARVEDFELEIIKMFINSDYNVNIIFTKADQASEKDLNELENYISQNIRGNLDFIRVCSEEKELIGGRKINPFGKENVMNKINNNFWNDLVLRLPKRINILLAKEVNKWHDNFLRYLKININRFDSNTMTEVFNTEVKKFIDKLDKQIINRVIRKEIKIFFNNYNKFNKVTNLKSSEDESIYFPNFDDLLLNLEYEEKGLWDAVKSILTGEEKINFLDVASELILVLPGIPKAIIKPNIFNGLVNRYNKNLLLKKLKINKKDIKRELRKLMPIIEEILVSFREKYNNDINSKRLIDSNLNR
jgi:GTP-binding protein EngB required for normal cell division